MLQVTGRLTDEAREAANRAFVVGPSAGAAAVALDAAAIVCSALIAGVAYHLISYETVGYLSSYAGVGGLMALLYVGPQAARGGYDVRKLATDGQSASEMLTLWNLAAFTLLVAGFLMKTTADHSRGALLLFYPLGLAALVASRAVWGAVYRLALRRGWIATSRVMLIGTQAKIAELWERYDLRTAGFQIARTITLVPPGSDGTASSLDQQIEAAVESARRLRVDDVFLLVPWSDNATIEKAVCSFKAVPAALHLGPERVLDRFTDLRIARTGPVPSLHLTHAPMSHIQIIAKRCLDVCVAMTALVLLGPLLALIALAVKFDSPGPVLFRQRRHGFNQSTFEILKFRTMHVIENDDDVVQAKRNDDRVTRVGRWLRRLSLDELPQLLNVLKGDMAIVGPRPHAVKHNREYEQKIALYARRHNVKPGITGWAQVNGFRGETDTDEKMRARVDYDLYYIDNWSLAFDMMILARTISPRAMLNAY